VSNVSKCVENCICQSRHVSCQCTCITVLLVSLHCYLWFCIITLLIPRRAFVLRRPLFCRPSGVQLCVRSTATVLNQLRLIATQLVTYREVSVIVGGHRRLDHVTQWRHLVASRLVIVLLAQRHTKCRKIYIHAIAITQTARHALKYSGPPYKMEL